MAWWPGCVRLLQHGSWLSSSLCYCSSKSRLFAPPGCTCWRGSYQAPAAGEYCSAHLGIWQTMQMYNGLGNCMCNGVLRHLSSSTLELMAVRAHFGCAMLVTQANVILPCLKPCSLRHHKQSLPTLSCSTVQAGHQAPSPSANALHPMQHSPAAACPLTLCKCRSCCACCSMRA